MSIAGQYISKTDYINAAEPDLYSIEAAAIWTPVTNFEVRSEVIYDKAEGSRRFGVGLAPLHPLLLILSGSKQKTGGQTAGFFRSGARSCANWDMVRIIIPSRTSCRPKS